MDALDKNNYIGCLSILLIVWIFNSVITVIANIIIAIGEECDYWIACFIIVNNIVSILGIFLLLKFNKIGFYVFMLSMAFQIIIGVLFSEQVESNVMLRSIVGMILLLILMCFKNKNNKLNAFQTLGLFGRKANYEMEKTTNDKKNNDKNN